MRGGVAILALALGLVGVGPASSQPRGAYLQLVDEYREGSTDAPNRMSLLSEREVSAGVDACLFILAREPRNTLCGPRHLMAAAMLHADAADLLLGSDPGRARAHLQAARRLLQSSAADPIFGARWHAHVSRLLLAHGFAANAATTVNQAIVRYPKTAELFAARGVITETTVLRFMRDVSDLREAVLRGDRFDPAVTRSLISAAADYRHALELDPAHTDARLRLGWNHLLQGDGRATDDFGRLVSESTPAGARYLAHLFRGTASERDRRLSDALTDYAQARQAGPGHPTACVAHAHGLYISGELSRAQGVAAECLDLPADDDHPDPWWLFRIGLYDAAEWLRDEARKP